MGKESISQLNAAPTTRNLIKDSKLSLALTYTNGSTKDTGTQSAFTDIYQY